MEKRLGYYAYSWATVRYPTARYETLRLRVEIIGETEKRYQIKYLGFHANRKPVGTVTWVQKKSVTLDKPSEPPKVQREVRLPYKDD